MEKEVKYRIKRKSDKTYIGISVIKTLQLIYTDVKNAKIFDSIYNASLFKNLASGNTDTSKWVLEEITTTIHAVPFKK